MPFVDDDNDCEKGNGSVTPLKYALYRRSPVPSVTDLTGLDAIISSTANVKERHTRRSTVAFKVTPPRRSPSAAAKVKPGKSTVGRQKPPQSTVGREDPPRSTAATVHASADLMTSTIISMPDGMENENFIGNVDAMNAMV